MSLLIVRRTGSLHDPEVKSAALDFSGLARNTYRAYRNAARGIKPDKLAERSVWSGLGGCPSALGRHMSDDAMTRLAISRPRRRIPVFPTRRLVVTPQMAASTPGDHEVRYVIAFTRLERVEAVRPRIGRPMRLARSLPMHSSTLLSLARTMDGSLLDHRAPSPGAYCNEYKSSHSLCC